MVSSTTLFVGFAAAASFVAASPTGPPTGSTSDKEVYKITNFFSRKPEGVDISTLSFDIAAKDGLKLTCHPYDPATSTSTNNFEDKHVYACGKDSPFSFSFENAANKLWLWHTVDSTILIGNATVINQCRAAGHGPNDKVCQQAGSAEVTMIKTG
ncbi:5'-3' exoribonuclease 1 [Venturia nashicola]|uniref:5'-3' exoribonuclease 1 n=1 Tax=Venturia nashicola TaxID=86259 RepID=A0A4Z1PDH1_9PEZI|nr:5'-3' exoribonuclease 1 [Venturia nashicola]TLD35969.1 5'-3' exoribonuclease 1 [Venturia nashicola]